MLATLELNEVPPMVIDVRRQCKRRDTRELSKCLPYVEWSRAIYSTDRGWSWVVREHETSWQGCPLAPCRVRWWGLGHERINSMMDFEWSWTYEHIRTGVSFGLNVLSGGWQLSEAKQRQLVCELLHDSNSEGQCLQVHSWINSEPTSNHFYTVLSNNLFIS